MPCQPRITWLEFGGGEHENGALAVLYWESSSLSKGTMNRLHPFACRCFAAVLCLHLVGCAGQPVPVVDPAMLTLANYEKIASDGTQTLTAAEVIMGSKGMAMTPAELSRLRVRIIDGQQAYVWGDKDKHIVVYVQDGKVCGKGMRNLK